MQRKEHSRSELAEDAGSLQIGGALPAGLAHVLLHAHVVRSLQGFDISLKM